MAEETPVQDEFPVGGNFNEKRAWFDNRMKGMRVPSRTLLAGRAALRALPALYPLTGAKFLGKNKSESKAGLILPLFRAMLLYPVAPLAPTGENARWRASADSAADSADSAANSAYSAADSAASADSADSADSAYSAAASAYSAALSAYSAARSSARSAAAFDSDCTRLRSSGALASRRALATSTLWPEGIPSEMAGEWEAFSAQLRGMGDGWSIWVEWYEGMLAGARGGRFLFGLPTERALKLWLDVALIEEEIWQAGPATLNAEFRRLVEEARSEGVAKTVVSEEDVTAVASPVVTRTADGKLDAQPNPVIDKPVFDQDLPTLPARQKTLAETIVSSLPRNAPRIISSALKGYSEELLVRGTQPILGILGDLFSILEAELSSPGAPEWLDAGEQKAFERFKANHELLMKHFPLDQKREEVLANLTLDEAKIDADALRAAMKVAGERVDEAVKAGTATENFAKVFRAQRDNLEAVLSLPPSDLTVSTEDRIPGHESPQAKAKKRVLTGTGGFARAASLEVAKATIAEAAKGPILDAFTTLWRLIKPLLGVS